MKRRNFIISASSVSFGIGIAGCIGSEDEEVSLERPSKGTGDVTVKVFSDLGCPFCADFHNNVYPTLNDEYIEDDLITYEHYDFVVDAVDNSQTVHNTLRGVQERLGVDSMFEYKDRVYSLQIISENAMKTEAEEVGVDDVDEWYEEALDGRYNDIINEDKEIGEENYDVESTPTVVVGDNVIHEVDTDSPLQVTNVIDQQL